MTKSKITNTDLSKIRAKLLEKKNLIVSIFKEETMFDVNDTELLWKDLLNFIDNFLALTEKTVDKWNAETKFYQIWERHSEYRRIPWGRVLICSPGNAPIPLIPIMLLSFAAFDNEIILCPNRKTQKTARLLYEIIDSIIGSKCVIVFYERGCQNALKEFVNTSKVDLLYFQGGSKFRDEIYKVAYSNGVEVIFEGEGNVVAIVGSDINMKTLDKVTEKLFEAKKICAGQMCTSPNMIFIHRDISINFINKYIDLSSNCDFLPLMKIGQIEWIRSLITAGISKNYIKKVHPENYTNGFGIKPALITLSHIAHAENYLNIELFSPLAFLVGYNEIEDVITILKSSWKYGLQISLFSYDKNLVAKILSSLTFARITLNISPVYQNSLLPWGGYKLSGFSYVVNFLEKTTRPISIEGKIEGKEL